MDYMFMPLKRYFDFSGRSRRKEFWMYWLLWLVGFVVAIILDVQLGLGGSAVTQANPDGELGGSVSAQGGILTIAWVLLNLIPMIAVLIRRVHDNDKSGWFILIPVYGAIIAYFLEGTRGPNRFGPDPKGVPSQTFA